jgi:hypothetical protein
MVSDNSNYLYMLQNVGHLQANKKPFKDEAQTILFKDPVRTAL